MASLERLKPYIRFDYEMPAQVRDFPHHQIHGRLSKLFRVRNLGKYEVAIQQIIGQRMRNVIVESNHVATQLLHHKATRGFEQFYALNVVKGRVADPNAVAQLKQ